MHHSDAITHAHGNKYAHSHDDIGYHTHSDLERNSNNYAFTNRHPEQFASGDSDPVGDNGHATPVREADELR